jgi:sporulation protein YlmC with PRC-barrel domain
MRLTDLRHALVRTETGEKVGRVFEVHCDRGRIAALVCGPSGFVERLTGRTRGRRIPWTKVIRIARGDIIVNDD